MPSAAYCNQIKSRYNMTWPVLRDPTGDTVQRRWGIRDNRDADFVLDASGAITLKLEGGGGGAGGGESTVGPVIQRQLNN